MAAVFSFLRLYRPAVTVTGALLLQDGTSYLLLEDGVSKLLLQ